MLDGRVKTLHPRVHAAILARRDSEEDMASLAEQGIEPIDIVVVGIYPFEAEPGVEMIDIGGPTMLRAAAKNHAHVAVVSSADDYGAVLEELRERGEICPELRRALAAKVFARTSAYDARVQQWLSGDERLPDTLVAGMRKELDLAYGENPHQAAAYYAIGRPHLLSDVEKLHGRELSFINLFDLAAARELLAELGDDPACVIVKHANPCGVAVADTIERAYELALAGDPLSAFGMVCVLNRPVSEELGKALAERFVDILYAPSYDEGALTALMQKPATRILAGPPLELTGALDAKRVPGGVLVQEPDRKLEGRDDMVVVCGSPTDEQWADLLFAWTVCKHVTSNAIVIARDRQAIGIGAGQQSRVDAVKLAIEKAAERGHDLAGSVLASDAFFPYPDGPQAALDAGVTAIVQPGGSKRDSEVVEAVEAAGAAMVMTGTRHFRH
jgi:phosphoribosylaminoimidazolecarboxamide formyltransferase / IMP cyclohydrolase